MLKNLIWLGVFTVITVFAWIGFNIQHNLTTSQISLDKLSDVEPIPNQFDQEALNLLNQRNFIQSNLSEETSIKPEGTITPAPTTTNTDTEENSVYNDEANGFSILPPKDWEIDRSGRGGTIVIFLNQQTDQDSENSSPFKSNINITQESGQNTDLNTYVKEAKQQLIQLLENYKIIEEKTTTIDGMQAYLLEATFTQLNLKLKNRQLIIINQNKIFVITATSLESTWNKYQSIFESSLTSFKKI